MTLDDLERRRALLLQDYQIITGHLQEVDHWIEKLSAEAAQAAPAAPPEPELPLVKEPD